MFCSHSTEEIFHLPLKKFRHAGEGRYPSQTTVIVANMAEFNINPNTSKFSPLSLGERAGVRGLRTEYLIFEPSTPSLTLPLLGRGDFFFIYLHGY
jgi:hypothetical protein